MPSGLASLVLQASAPFTVLLAGVFLRERLTRRQVVGIVIAVAGLAAIAVHRGPDRCSHAGRADPVRGARLGDRQRL